MPVKPIPKQEKREIVSPTCFQITVNTQSPAVQLPVIKLTRNGRMVAKSKTAGCPIPPVKRSAPNVITGNMQALESVGKPMDTFIRKQFGHLGTEMVQKNVKVLGMAYNAYKD